MDYSEAGQRISVPANLHVLETTIVRLSRAYFMESDGPDRNRIENDLVEKLQEEKELRSRCYS